MKKHLLLYVLISCGSAVPASAEYTNAISATYEESIEYQANKEAFSSIGLHNAYTGSGGTAYSGFSGKGVTIAVVDSGTHETHEDLTRKISALRETAYNLNIDEHGTHVTGIIAAEKNDKGMHGVAYDALFLPFSTYLEGGCEDASVCMSWKTAWNILLYDDYDEIKIINNSWEGNSYDDEMLEYMDDILRKDKLVVAAAGNKTELSPSVFPAGIAAYDDSFKTNLINVVAYDPTKLPNHKNFIAGYSNLAQGAQKWTLAAPGTFYSTVPYEGEEDKYASLDGTSMATPAVSGVAALVQEAFPYMGGKQIADVLFSTAFKKEDLELSSYMIQEDNGITRFLYFTDIESGKSYNEALADAGISCAGTTYCHQVTFEDVFGQGLINAGDAVKGPKYFDADRLTASDYSSSWDQFFYVVDVADYDSVWGNDISQKTITDEESEYFGKNIGLVKLGTGTLTLAGGNTFSGLSVAEEGTLILTGSMKGGVVVNNGDFVLDGGTLSGKTAVYSNGFLEIDSGTLSNELNNQGITVAITGTATGNIVNSGVFAVSGLVTEDSTTPGNFISSGSFVNKNLFYFEEEGSFSGTLNNEADILVTGNSFLGGQINNAASGKIVVNSGVTLSNSGTIENNGILAGSGTVSGVVNNNAQGSVSTTLTFDTLNSAGNIILSSTGDAPAIMQVNTLNLSGGKFILSDTNKHYENGQAYTVINFSSLSGFDTFEHQSRVSDFAVTTAHQETGRIDITVDFVRMSEQPVLSSFSTEEQKIVQVFDRLYLDENQSDFRRFYYYSAPELKKQVNLLRSKIQPVQNEHLPLTKVMASRVSSHLFSKSMMRDAASTSRPHVPMQQYQGKYYRGRSGGNEMRRQKIWGQFLGGSVKEDGNSSLNQGNMNTKSVGMMFGYDFDTSDNGQIGVTAGLASSRLKQDASQIDVRDIRAGFYAGSRFGKMTLNALLLGGFQQYKSDRHLLLGGSDSVSRSQFNGYSAEFDLTLGYDFARLPYRDYSFYFRSYLSAGANYIYQEAYKERGTSFLTLGVDAVHETSFSVSPGFTIGYTFADTVISADIGYQRILSGDSTQTSAYFLTDATKTKFSSLSSDTDKGFFNAGLGVKTDLTHDLKAHLWAGARRSRRTEAFLFSATFSYEF